MTACGDVSGMMVNGLWESCPKVHHFITIQPETVMDCHKKSIEPPFITLIVPANFIGWYPIMYLYKHVLL
jgi:hypothetical protein